MKFKKGDKVRLIPPHNFAGKEGRILYKSEARWEFEKGRPYNVLTADYQQFVASAEEMVKIK